MNFQQNTSENQLLQQQQLSGSTSLGHKNSVNQVYLPLLQNSSGNSGVQGGQQQKMNFGGGSSGALTSRDYPQSQHQIQILQSQQMIPSNYTHHVGTQNIQLKQSQNEKIKSFSRKLAKIVSSGGGGGGSASNSRTPNSKKKVKVTGMTLGQTLTTSINNPQSIAQMIRGSGQNTSRVGQNISNMIQTSMIYGCGSSSGIGGNQGGMQSARSTNQQQIHSSLNRASGAGGGTNSTFDMDEHIKNEIRKSLERKNRQNSNQNISTQAIQSYLQQQQNATQLITQQQNYIAGGSLATGSRTARNQLASQNLNEYSPEAVPIGGPSKSKSPTNRNNYYQNQLYLQTDTTTHKNTIFSNFSNSTYYMGQKKNSQQSHSLGKKNSYQGVVNSIMIPSKNNVSGSQSRKRGSHQTKKEVIPSKSSLSNRQQESEIFSATQHSIRHYDNVTLKKKRESLPAQMIGGGSKTARENPSSQYKRGNHINQSQNLNQSASKKQSNWFSPPSTSHNPNPNNNMSSSSNPFGGAGGNQHILSTIDNNSSQALIDKTIRTSQFVSPRSFLNKSGGGGAAQIQNISNIAAASQQYVQPRISVGDKNPLLFSYEGGVNNENLNQFNIIDNQQLQKLNQLRFFRNFGIRKVFRKWKEASQKQDYLRKRVQLRENMLNYGSNSIGECHKILMTHLNQVKYLQFVQEDKNDSSDFEKNKQSKINIFNHAVNNIRSSLEKLHSYTVKTNQEAEKRLRESQQQSQSLGRKNSIDNQQLRQAQQRSNEKDLLRQITQRCANFDRFLNFTLFSLSSTLAYMLMNNKSFSGQKIRTIIKFQIYGNNTNTDKQSQLNSMYQTHNEYFLGMSPNFKYLTDLVRMSIDESEQLIFNNRKLIENITKLTQLFIQKGQAGVLSPGKTDIKSTGQWDVNSFYSKIDFIMKQTQQKVTKEQVLVSLGRDIEEAENIMRRMDELKQILQFEERWNYLQNNQSQTDQFLTDMDSNRETWALMEKFNSLIQQIPRQPLVLRFLSLDFKPLYDQLSKIPKKISYLIEKKVASALETDTIALRQDLSKAYEILQQSPSQLSQYVEQMNTLKLMKETMGELNNRHDGIKKLSMLCKSDNRINIKDSVLSIVKEVETYIENLPILVRQSSERIEMNRSQMEQQMRTSCLSLSNKIKAFEKKYVDHYINDQSKLNESENTINELKYRQKMIDDLKQKVDLYQECITIMNMNDLFKNSSEITCFEDYRSLEKLHSYTLKLWVILDEWRQKRANLMQRPFLKLNFQEIANFVEESSSFFEQNSSEDPLFKEKLTSLSSVIKQEMNELQIAIYILKDLKKECLKKKHWNLIFNELSIPQLQQHEDFTLNDLQKYKIFSHNQIVRDIMKIAEKEFECDGQIQFIKQQIDENLAFKLTLYKEDIYIISEFDIVQQQVEEYIVQLKKIAKSPQITDLEIKDSATECLNLVQNMNNAIEKISDAQKTILGLDAVFTQPKIQKSLPQDYQKFCEIKKSFKININGKIQTNPSLKHFQAQYNSLGDSMDKIISKGTLIQKSLEDYLEAKRLAFPRFFFMTDKQFLDFIELSEQNLDFNRYINLLFPGVSKVFLDQPLQTEDSQFKVPPPMVNDLSQVKSEMIDINNQKGGILANQKEILIGGANNNRENQQDAFNSKKSNKNQPKPKEVLGFISKFNELFLFEKKVPYQQNKAECWLQGAENSMQETVGKLINYAVNTFPKQSLDEWILDYPQQVILTTIHLILTHEINELFEEMRKEKEGEGGRGQNGSDNGDSDDDYTGATPKTPDTRDLIKNSQISHRTVSQHVSQKSSVRFMKKKDDLIHQTASNGQRKVSTYNSKSSGYSSKQQFIKNQARTQSNQQYNYIEEGLMHGSELDYPQLDGGDGDEFSESELEAMDQSRERKRFASNMFGSDFDLGLIADNKDDNMRILQEKSFKGLYLRLQFWINQICKSLYMSKGTSQKWKQAFEKDMGNLNAPESPSLSFDLHPVQRLVMQTIINFLTYMRDVVYELKSKKIDNVEDFEWQKQMRLTWNGKDAGCKVDCGAWTTQQANEYLGSNQRVPLTPLTNKYFVFISAAFREKSAVLFRCIPSHDYSSDIFQEFSNICSVPFKQYQCNPKMSMKSLMQFLNGAALASVWIFFEHVDKLDYLHLQTFNKEIQMVQQQFIIAELSQDSSVVTAHITVGNQSISQCQRSIERIREQASLENKKNDQIQIRNSNIGGLLPSVGADIKIEDNIHIQNRSHSNFDDDDEDSIDAAGKNFNFNDRLLRQSHKRDLQSNQVLQNLSQLDLEDEFNHHDNNNLEEDNELKLDDNQNNTAGGGHSKINNKVCFGVFASISHQFNLKKEKWATEVSTALQSAFRVLSLTRPEMPVITNMLLKSEGFRYYKDLGPKINDIFFRVQDMIQLGDRDDSFTISVRDLKRMANIASLMLERQISKECLGQISKNEVVANKLRNKMMVFNNEKKSKNQILKEMDEEDQREEIAKKLRQSIEQSVVAYVVYLFLFEKLYSHMMSIRIPEDKLRRDLREVISIAFGRDLKIDIEKFADETNKKNSDLLVTQASQSRGLKFNQDDMKKINLMSDNIKRAKPLGIVGKTSCGKSEFIKLVAEHLLKKNLVYFNSNVAGTYRELYGIYDPFSTTQQTVEAQIGPVKNSIFSILKNELSKKDSCLVIEGETDPIFNEAIIPYLEYQSFNEPSTIENDSQTSISIQLPNGIQENLQKNIPIIFEMKTLENTSPRFISAIQIINQREQIDLKECAFKMKTKFYQAGSQKVQNTSSLRESLDYCVDDLIMPTINELKKSKVLERNGIDLIIAVQGIQKTFISFLQETRQLPQSIEPALIRLSIMAIVYGLGYSLRLDGRNMIDEIFNAMKSKLGIRGSIFNFYLDLEAMDIKEYNHRQMFDHDIVLNLDLLRASTFSKLLLKNNISISIVGECGCQKSTIARYLIKNHQADISSKIIKLPTTCLISQRSLRNILSVKPSNFQGGQQEKSSLIVIEDVNIAQNTFQLDILEYIRLAKLNKYAIFNPDFKEIQKIPIAFNVITTRNSNESQNTSGFNTYYVDTTTVEYDDFLKSFITRKIQIQPQYQQSIGNVIYQSFKWLQSQGKIIDVSTKQGLSNLNSLNSLLSKVNQSTYKDQNIVETIINEFQRVICDRILFPDSRKQALEQIVKIVKKEVPNIQLQNYNVESLDNMVQFSNKQKIINQAKDLKEVFGNHSCSLLKTVCDINSNLRKQNQHYLIVSPPGTQISESLQSMCEQSKYQIVEPEQASKYRDVFKFIESVNGILIETLKRQKKVLVLVKDSLTNDLSYLDFLVNLLTAVKDSTTTNSLSLFNTFETVIGKGLRQALIDCARELHNQQISHSPHSGISSPASPSSLTSTITDNQLLMSSLSKLSSNVHFILNIESLQNYQSYTSHYPQIENIFQVTFISQEETVNADPKDEVFSDIQKWVSDFILKHSYDPTYEKALELSQHPFNNKANPFFIPENKSTDIMKSPIFENSYYHSINSELNLQIPVEFAQSSYRLQLFKETYNKIKHTLYKTIASQKHFYTQYFAQYQQLQADFMQKILKETPQVGKNHIAAFGYLQLQEKIEQLKNVISTREQAIKIKERDQSDLSVQLQKLSDELKQVKTQGDGRIQAILGKLKLFSNSDYKSLSSGLVSGSLSDTDMEILSAAQAIIQSKRNISTYLIVPDEFLNRLQQVINQGNLETIVNKHLKSLSKRAISNDIEKTITGQLFNLIIEISRKSSVEKKIAQYEAKLSQVKEVIGFNAAVIQLYNSQIAEAKEEYEDFMIKKKNMEIELRDILRKIDLKELKGLRNEHKLKSLIKQGRKSEQKLDKVKIRLKNLEGDCLILACSVAYLGALSQSERMEVRKDISEKLLQKKNIESSEYWQNNQSEQVHSKYFKKIIQNDFGLKSQLFNKINHLFVDSLLSEFIFTLIFAPTTPVIYDSVGNYQQYITEEIFDEMQNFKVKMVFSSDYMIQEKLTMALQNPKKLNSLIFLNDINDYSKEIHGKCQDQALLHKLSDTPFLYRVPNMFLENPSLDLPLMTLFSSNQAFNLNNEYLSKATIYNATFVNKNEAWIEIKQILLKHFLPDNYQKIVMIKQQTQTLKEKIVEKQRAFDQLFLKVKSQAVEDKDYKQLEEVRLYYQDLKQLDEDYQQYNQAFHNLINEHPLLASYSNIFVILYYALKELSKFTEEITYSWKIYTKVIDMIIAKIIRDLTMNLKNKENEDSDGDDGGNQQDDLMNPDERREKKKSKKDKEFTIDEEFFHSVIMPSIYSTIVAGIKQEHVPLFNLIFSLEIALKKTTVTQEEKDFFVQRFFRIKNCYDWRLNPHKPSTIPSGFADPNQRMKQTEYMAIKRDLIKIYPDFKEIRKAFPEVKDLRKLFELVEIKIGKEYQFKEANSLLYQKLFKNNSEGQWKDLPLIKKINIGYLCPDDEWRSKITQFVYEELTTIFDFTEDLNKLHNFIKTASWSLPVALFTSNSINIVNTVCSIASYYGVGLEVLRTDYQQSIKKHESYYANKEVNDNIKSADQLVYDTDKPLSNEAACVHYDQIDSTKEDRIIMQKQNYQRMFSKDELEIDDKQITQNQSSMQLIQKCAENGTWVLISTLKFPSFWYKISRKLEKMAKKGKILNTFRLFFDLQGYSLQEIPESFLFNHCVKFYLTEKNNEDMEGFNDVWANILNDDLLNAKDLHNVHVLEPPSDLLKINLNLESNIYESSMDSLLPQQVQAHPSHVKDMNPTQKKVKDDKITYSMSQYQSKDTIILPQIFTQEHMKDIMSGGNDLKSPKGGKKAGMLSSGGFKNMNQSNRRNFEDEISEIQIEVCSVGTNNYRSGVMGQSGLLSNTQSLLMDDMSRMEGAFLSELNHAFAKKSNMEEEKKEQPPQKYEMVKKPAPGHKRMQPPQKQ